MAAQKHEIGLDLRTPFCRADARRAGIPVRQLRSARFRRLFHDVYLGSDVPVTPAVLAAAVLSVSPFGSHASHHTAAGMWGGIVPAQPLTHVSSPRGGTRSQRRGVCSHQISTGSRIVSLASLQVSSPEQAFRELATELSLVDLVVLGDSLVKAGTSTTARLIEATHGWRGRGSRAARRAAQYVRTGVDSPMETRLRLLMVFAGLPEPVINHVEYGARGRWEKRFDLSFPHLLLIIEYDGRQHAEDAKQYSRDIVRREELDAAGWRIIVVRSKDIYSEPGQTLERIVGAMRHAGAKDLPATLDHDWEKHFPGR